MSERRFPARVMLSHEMACHCREVNSVCGAECKMGLSKSSTWWFCGCACSSDVTVTHCHLFGLQQQLTAGDGRCSGVHQRHRQHLPASDVLNGKTQRRLVLDGDKVQLATVMCSYAVPTTVESLDLAAGCLERMSGKYFMSRNVPCVMSVCGCRSQTLVTERQQQHGAADGHCRRQPSTTHASESLYCTREASSENSSTNTIQKQRCTRSREQVVSSRDRETSDHSLQPSDKLHMSSETIRCSVATDRKTVTDDACRSLTEYRRQRERKVMIRRKQTRHSSRSTLTRQLRSHTMSLTSQHNCRQSRQSAAVKGTAVSSDVWTSAVQRQTLRNQRLMRNHLLMRNRLTVKQRLTAAAALSASDCDVSPSAGQRETTRNQRLITKQRPTRKQRLTMKQQPTAAAAVSASDRDAALPVRCTDAALPVTCTDNRETKSAGESPQVTQSESVKSPCDAAKLSALSVDVSFDYDDVCSSPISPLPVNLKMADSDQCNSLLQQAASLLSRKRSAFITRSCATVCKTVRPYAIGPLSVLSCLSVCNVDALWPNGWMDQDETWLASRPRPRTHCVR